MNRIDYQWFDDAVRMRGLGLDWVRIVSNIFSKYGEMVSTDTVRKQVSRKAPKFCDRYDVSNNAPEGVNSNHSEHDSENNGTGVPETSESMEYKSDGTYISQKLISIMKSEMNTPESIIKAHGLDAGLWQVVSYKNNMWNAISKDEGQIVQCQSKLTVKPITNGLSLDRITEHFNDLDRANPTYLRYPISIDVKSKMAEVNLCDLHFAKLCWHGDCGSDYDHKIARDNVANIMSRVYVELSTKKLDYILFVWSNDYFNSDTIDNKTTAFTQQDVDCRWQKMFNTGVEILISTIDLLSSLAPVKTFYTRSNHDTQTGYHALKYLEAWYRKNDSVEIDIDAYPRKYILYGKNLIGFTHGDKEKPVRLASLMPLEVPQLWAQSKFREMHTGHLHSEHMIEEVNGVITRRISSPTALDTWHIESGYIGAIRKIQTFIYDDEDGLEQIINTTVRAV